MSSPAEKRGALSGRRAPSAPLPTPDRGLILALDPAGAPKLSVTILLDRRPASGETSIEPLISRATFAFTAMIEAPHFARRADFRLCDGEIDIQHVSALGEQPAAALSQTFDRERALRLLAALRGEESRISVHCDVEYRAAVSGQPLIARARLSDVVDAIGIARLLDYEAVVGIAGKMLGDGRLSVTPQDELGGERLAAAFLAMTRPLLRPVTTGEGRRWRVLPVTPNPTMLSGRIGSDETAARIASYSQPLEKLFARVDDLDRHVRIIAPDGKGDFSPVAPLQAQRAARKGSLLQLGGVDGSYMQLQALARPTSAKANAHSMIAVTTAQPISAVATMVRPEFIAVHDLDLGSAANPAEVESLPRIDEREAALWSDRRSPERFWYAPEFVLQRPAPTDDPDSAAFAMQFRAEGHRADGKPGLVGTIRFRLQRRMTAGTEAAWESAGRPEIAPVPTENLSIQLRISFRDESGATRSQSFPGAISDAGDNVDVTVELMDDWLRLAYGSIAYAGFQTQVPELSVAYSFRGYVPISEHNIALLFDRKQALVALRSGRARGPGDAFLDTRTLSWRDGATAIRLSDDPASIRMPGGHRRTPSAIATLTIKPSLLQATVIAELIRDRKYGVQSIARAQALPALFPCNEFGAFYREEVDGNNRAIGCQDAFRLGQTVYRQYERLDELGDVSASVWRSLQQPGRFLIVPHRWSIARFGGQEPGSRAWRPAIFLYSSVDPDNAARNRCALLASLVPDIDPARTLEVRHALRKFAADPQLLTIGDIDATASFQWTVPTLDGLTVNAVRLDDCIQVTAECPLDTMPLLLRMIETAGLAGSVSFGLPDGTTMASDLRIDLSRIVGPLPDGPVEIERHADRLMLTNPVERAIDVSEILIDTAEAEARTIAIDSRLEPGQSLAVEAVAGDAALAVRCAPADGPASLTEIRSFIEDVHSNVAFVNLVNYQAHALAALSVEARIRDAGGSQQLPLAEGEPVASLEFVLPLTRYLVRPILEYTVTKTFADGTSGKTNWLEWSLADDGNVVSITWDKIA